MAIEKRWHQIEATPFTADGNADGLKGAIKVASIGSFKVKQKVTIEALGLSPIRAEIKAIPDCFTIIVGPFDTSNKHKNNNNILARTDLSVYTTALSATIRAAEQIRPTIPPVDYQRAMFEEEPTVAMRVYNVDTCGDPYTTDNPFPVDATFEGEVNIDYPNAEGLKVLDIPLKQTEYSFTFPNKTQYYRIKVRDHVDVLKIGLTAGAIFAGDYKTVDRGNDFSPEVPNDFVDNYTLYFESKSKDNIKLEIEYWYFS